jgi:hypothetical protein
VTNDFVFKSLTNRVVARLQIIVNYLPYTKNFVKFLADEKYREQLYFDLMLADMLILFINHGAKLMMADM